MIDINQALYNAVRSSFDFSLHGEIIKDEFRNVACQMQRPSAIFKPSLTIDGNQWCAMYGEDLQSGVAGFGDSPALAMEDFDKSWFTNLNK